ncbi:MAG: hypothetical protein A2W93_05990 [Bacteroidetes bacterium GWF2_43_63]|nr:MAG: hypothetical protein A2W94_04485 [Bacteroidetes bacterium GWE2_42_42]OFY55969.1 MAG: hypothetical protein A2W93_05990 [Bacteroidetes bacterium GWF2_43_63]HBG71534.1 hypothetical protein [Bacteroidales bacterium]HCB63006.1 hypothetical protein [Bacteroidales bacterium]HCY22295.1 hypothetical protein [Bacteroidales bacterium]
MIKQFCLLALLLFSGYVHLCGQTNISYSYDDNGNRYNRTVLLLKAAEGYDTTQTEEGMTLNMAELVITAFPNPTMGEITLSASDNIEQGVIHIFDLSGRSVITQEFTGQTTSVDLINQNPGQYLMIIQAGNERKEITIIKE